MRLNTALTIYNRYVDPTTRADKYQRTALAGPSASWEDRKAANAARTGIMEVDQAAIYIPKALGANYVKSKAWLALTVKTGKWTLQLNDIIVKGVVTDTITDSFTASDLRAKYNDCLVISSVDNMDMGSPSMWHWEIGAR